MCRAAGHFTPAGQKACSCRPLLHPARLPMPLAASRVSAPLAYSPAPVERDGETSGAAGWIQTNLMQGVALDPSTLSVMIVYFVQGALGLA